MMPISSVNSGAARPLPQAEQADQTAKPQQPEEEGRRAPRPCRDEYIPEKKEERCIGDTGKVDREIEQLKKKRAELEQRLSTETDEAKIQELKRQLSQVERELRQKDSDGYRRQHTAVTRLS